MNHPPLFFPPEWAGIMQTKVAPGHVAAGSLFFK
jgi:hypothetical protein